MLCSSKSCEHVDRLRSYGFRVWGCLSPYMLQVLWFSCAAILLLKSHLPGVVRGRVCAPIRAHSPPGHQQDSQCGSPLCALASHRCMQVHASASMPYVICSLRSWCVRLLHRKSRLIAICDNAGIGCRCNLLGRSASGEDDRRGHHFFFSHLCQGLVSGLIPLSTQPTHKAVQRAHAKRAQSWQCSFPTCHPAMPQACTCFICNLNHACGAMYRSWQR